MSTRIYSVKVDGRAVAKFRADLCQASAPVEVWGDGAWIGTQWQTASGKHSEARLACLILSGDPDTEHGDAFTVECDGRNVGQGVIGSHFWGETDTFDVDDDGTPLVQSYIDGGAYGVMGTVGKDDWCVVHAKDGVEVSQNNPLTSMLTESAARRKAEMLNDAE
jgi:hypothetical protein